MTSEIQNPNDKKVYDLEERAALLGEGIIEFAKTFEFDLNFERLNLTF